MRTMFDGRLILYKIEFNQTIAVRLKIVRVAVARLHGPPLGIFSFILKLKKASVVSNFEVP